MTGGPDQFPGVSGEHVFHEAGAFRIPERHRLKAAARTVAGPEPGSWQRIHNWRLQT
jgi:hypothetical protein